MSRQTEWRSDLDEELRRWFHRDNEGDCGLRSAFGAQLERAAEGVSYRPTGRFVVIDDESYPAEDMPAPMVELGRDKFLEVQLVGATLGSLPHHDVTVLEAFYGPAGMTPAPAAEPEPAPVPEYRRLPEPRRKRSAQNGKGLGPDDYPEQPFQPKGARRRSFLWTGQKAESIYDRLRDFFDDDREKALAVVAAVSRPIRTRTEAWLLSMRTAELEHAMGEHVGHLRDMALRHESLLRAVRACEEHPRVCWIQQRERLLRRLRHEERLPPPQRVDVGAAVLHRWGRAPTLEGLVETLRRACHAEKHAKSTEARQEARALVYEAMRAGKRDLGSARGDYLEARRRTRQSFRRRPLEARRARVAAYEASLWD